MTFPETNLPIQVELDLGGTWTDITSKVYERDAIRITRGRTDWGGVVDPSRCTLTLKNHTGDFSPRNPMSPYYGLIGRNTPIRVWAAYGETYMEMTGTALDGVTTPDHASLDITGDIDIRCDITTDQWVSGNTVDLAGKYDPLGEQRAWAFYINGSGRPGLAWTPDGTFPSRLAIGSTEPVAPALSGRLAVRVTLDVNNGSGGYTVRFYTAPTISGTWVQLGDTITGGTTTSIFSSTAPLVVGDVAGVSSLDMVGRYHACEVRSGIGGTVVASPHFTAQTPGATGFTDGAGRTWSLTGSASLTNRQTRFHGEISSWPIRWGTGGHDVYVTVEASGILRRLGQGASPLQSTLRRRIPSDPNLLAYWPLEEGKTATRAYSPLAGVTPMAASGLDYEQVDTLAGSSPLPALDSTMGAGLPMLTGFVPASAPGAFLVEYVYRHDSPAATLWTYMRILTTGTVREWYLQMSATGGRIIGQNSDGTTVISDAFSWGAGQAPFNAWYRMRFYVTQNGSNYDYNLNWIRIGASVIGVSGSGSGTAGRITTVGSPPGGYATDLNNLALGHIAVFGTTTSTVFNLADHGYNGERSGDRLQRLRTEEELPFTISGPLEETELMGPQRPDTIMALLQEAADVDGGILYERRDSLSLAYRSRTTLYNQPVGLSLDYQGSDGLVTPLEPVDDDQRVRNDILVTRTDGGSGRSVAAEGPLSTLAPPQGVGRYNEAITLNLFDDEQTSRHAQWRLHLGTWDEARYPQVRVLLQSAPAVIADAATMDVGDRMQITNPPKWLPPEAIDLQVQGYTELLHQRRWELEFNCTPYGPWEVGVYDDAARGRFDTGGTVLAVPVTATDTVLPVTTTDGTAWTTNPADMPFDVAVGGEVATVTQITGVAQDAFARTVSNGWGTADSGQAWATAGGAAADYAVTGGTGRHITNARGTIFHSYVPVTTADVDVRVDWSLSAVPVADSTYVFPIARYTDATHMYLARVQVAAGGAMLLTIRKRDGAESLLGTQYTTGLTYTAGAWYTVRLAVTGSSLSAKVWPRSNAEPAAWQVTATDTALTAPGSVGVRSLVGGATTNTLPMTTQFDNLYVGPQAMTVTRSVNGLTKTHSSGADIRLAHPTIYAL
ncbi:hypothetical protein [Streptomyces sp. NPDC088746]|uniref:hypothetical protein n=1 Tax=Streptomyces sp. NPDC088746 TaxID=3365885 RepID=UPI0038080479